MINKMIMNDPKFRRAVFIIMAALTLASCSLFRVTLSTNDEPMPRQDLNTRLAVRSFYSEFAKVIAQTTDSIIKNSPDAQIAANAIILKMNSSMQLAKAAYQTIPEAALVDVWTFIYQLDDFLSGKGGQQLFGEYQPWLTHSCSYLKKRIEKTSTNLRGKNKQQELKAFVIKYAEENPFNDLKLTRGDILPGLIAHLGLTDSTYVKSTGSMAEVMTDVSERIGIISEQLSNQIEWQKQLFSVKWENDSLPQQMMARTDSITLLVNRIVTWANNTPEMASEISVRLREELSPMLLELGAQLHLSVIQLSQQRDELQLFLDQQRALITESLDQTSKDLLKSATDSVVKIVRSLILYFILLILVLFGLPFGLGYAFGRMRSKKQSKKE